MQQNISPACLFELFICSSFVDNKTISSSLIRETQNIWIQPSTYKEFIFWPILIYFSTSRAWFQSEQNIWIVCWFKSSICCSFVNNKINSKSFLGSEQNIWIKSSYQLLISSLFLNNKINLKSLVSKKQNTWIEYSYQLFISCLFAHNKMNSKRSVRI